MVYRNFNLRLILRIVFIVAFSFCLGISINSQSIYLLLPLSLIELLLIVEFIHFLNRTNKQILFFIKAIKNEDTTLRFNRKTGNAIINELHQSLNELNVILQQIKVDSTIRERYFSEILRNLATGVIVLTEEGFVDEVNPAALELLNLPTFTHLSQLERIDPRFKASLAGIKNKQKKVFPLTTPQERIQIVTRCSIIRVKNQDVKLITLQDIRGELERKEIDSWVKLIRVLSHEIMNSLAPVTSIAQSLQDIWQNKLSSNPFADDDVARTINGLSVVSEMSENLIRFVQSYRVLSKAPEPNLTPVNVHSFLDRLSIMISPMKEDFTGRIQIKQPQTNFQFIADEQMMVQVIINLVKNAIEAMENIAAANIEIASQKRKGITEISITDNGKGIPEEMIDEIFIPFFTTKEHGSGIGLSYSRQIVRAHGGSLLCRSKPGNTVFTIRL